MPGGYDGWLARGDDPNMNLEAAHRMFSDGEYAKSLQAFRAVLQARPEQPAALRGIARSLMQLAREEPALTAFDAAIAADPEFAAAHANRAILLDRIGRHREALEGYERALAMDPSLDEGPGWLTRFMRNQHGQQASLSQRAGYLRAQLARAPDQRLLRIPEVDARQRAYEHQADRR